jgi:phage-related protein
MGAGINAVKAAPEAMAGFKAGLEGIEVANGGAATAFGKLGNGINVAKEAFKAGVSGIADYGRQLAVTAADAIKHAATVAAQGAKAAAGWITQAGKVAAAWAVQFAQMIAKGVLVVTAMVVNAAVAAGAWIAGAVATAAAWVVANAAMLGVWGLIIAAVVGAVALIIANWDSIAGFFKGIWEGIQTGVGNLITWVTENWPLILAVLTGPIGLAVLAIVKNWDTIKAMFSAAWEFIKGIWNGVVGFFGNIGNGIANVFNNAVNGVRNAFNGAIAFVRGVPGSILSAIGNLGYLLWNAGSDMIRGLINGIANNSYAVVNKITEIARGALDAVKKFFGIRSPSRVMAEMGGYVMEGFGNGIDDMAGSVANSAHSAADGVLDAFSSMQGTIGNLQTDFGVNGTSTLTNQFAPAPIQSQLAPAVLDPQGSNAANANAGVTINQTNEVHSELDMDVVNRNLAWELNKI